MELTISEFKSRGYKEYNQNPTFAKGDCFLQRAVYDENDGGKIYFINVYHYIFTSNSIVHESFSAEGQFNRGYLVFNVQLISIESVDQVEDFFKEIWNKLNCDRYDGQPKD